MMRVIFVLSVFFFIKTSALVQLDEVFSWKELEFVWPNEQIKTEAIKSGDYIPKNNLPLGLDRWKDKLFITMPRWKAGVAATLGYVPLNPINKTAAIIPYPDQKSHILPKKDEKPSPNHITSTFRVTIDPCDRLWIVDTGLDDLLGNTRVISQPAVVIYDLKTDQLLRRYVLNKEDSKEDSFFPAITVDVTPETCDQAFAYISDVGANGLVVYNFADNESWRVEHHYFHFDPLKGDLNVGGVNFQWTDGVFGVALGPLESDGYRTVYFHPLASTKEFSVCSAVLRNKTAALDKSNYHLFKLEGEKGDHTQTSSSIFDEKTNVIFLTQIQKNGVACWNPKKPLRPENVDLVVQDNEKMIFLNDIKIDSDRNLWAFADKMPEFIYKGLDSSKDNYRIFKGKVEDVIKNSACVV